MRKYKGFLIDLDGTMYRGDEKIETAVQFVHRLIKRGIPFLFVTNNSSKTPEQVATHLQGFGIPATGKHVITSSLATANYIRKKQSGALVFMIGENGLKEALIENGLHITSQQADFVAVGIDRGITYEKLAQACLAIRSGAVFLSTNADKAIPTERGFLPGNGAITSLISVSTGIEPHFIGKPQPVMIRQALEQLGLKRSEALMIGDNYDTDILAGINAGVDTLLVDTGITKQADLQHVKIQPTYTIEHLGKWAL